MRKKLFEFLASASYNHPGRVLLAAGLFLLLMSLAASRLEVEATWTGMIPKKEASLIEFKRITRDFDGAVSLITIGIDGAGEDTLVRIAGEIETALSPMIKDSLLRRLTWKMPVDFMKDHGLMLTREKDLKDLMPLFKDFNLVPFLSAFNGSLEKTFVGGEDKLSTNERAAVERLSGIEQWITGLSRALSDDNADSAAVAASLDKFWLGEEMYLSTDRRMLIMTAQPWAPMDSLKPAIYTVNKMDTLLAPVKKAHPGQTIRTTGIHVIGRDEMRAGTEDSFVSTLAAFALILTLLIVAFRMKAAPVLAGIVLIVGIVWDMGLAGLFIGRLNMMTLFCTVYLIGLGVDFSIHFLQGYNEQRLKSRDAGEALRRTFDVTGAGILTGGLTTALAFLVLMFTDFDLFRELGFISGVGIVACLAAAFTVLPALLAIRERRALRKGKNVMPPPHVGHSDRMAALGRVVSKRPGTVIAAILAVTLAAGWFAKNRTWFDSNWLHEEARGLESLALQTEIVDRFQLSQDNAVFTVPDLDSAYRATTALEDEKTVSMVESPSLLCPPPRVQAERRPYLEKIRALAAAQGPAQKPDLAAFRAEMERLEANIIEMGQTAYLSVLNRIVRRTDRMTGLDSAGNKVAPGIFSPLFDLLENTDPAVLEKRLSRYQALFRPHSMNLVRRMADTADITWDQVPDEYGANLRSSDGSQFLVSVYPRQNTWDDLLNSPFLKLLHRKVPQATGMTPLMEVLYVRGREEGRMAVIYAVAAIFLLLLLDFKSLKYALLTMLPLGFAAVWLAGGYGLFGAPFTIMNIMALPLILGIGVDDGVHICHRFRHDQSAGMGDILGAVGRAVFLTTATTMMAFGSLAGSHMRGNVRMGLILFFGVGLCFVMSVTLLPALLSLKGGKR